MLVSTSNAAFHLKKLIYVILFVLSLGFTCICTDPNATTVQTHGGASAADINAQVPTPNPTVSATVRKNIVCRDPDLGGQMPADIHMPRKVS